MNRIRKFPGKLLWRLYYISLVASLALNIYWLYTNKFHYHFSFQYLPQFFAWFGFFGCMVLILIAKAVGWFIVVDEDYYEKRQR